MNERRPSFRPEAESAFLGARSTVVNRTRRLVRAHALDMHEQRSRRRSLWAPVLISSILLLVGCYAVWVLFDAYDVNADGIVDASDQMFIFLLWLVPASALSLGFLWSRRTRRSSGFGEVSS